MDNTKRILFVDNRYALNQHIIDKITANGYMVTTATSQGDALDRCREFKSQFDIIVTTNNDAVMAEKLIQSFRKSGINIPVIIHTRHKPLHMESLPGCNKFSNAVENLIPLMQEILSPTQIGI